MAYNLTSASLLNNDILIAGVKGQVVSTTDAAGAITATNGTFHNDGSSVARAMTLADGVEGAFIRIYKSTGAGTATVTPTNFKDGTSIALANVGDLVSMRFKSGQWELRTAINVGSEAAITAS